MILAEVGCTRIYHENLTENINHAYSQAAAARKTYIDRLILGEPTLCGLASETHRYRDDPHAFHTTLEVWTRCRIISIWTPVVNVAHLRCDQLRKGLLAPLALRQKFNSRVRGLPKFREAEEEQNAPESCIVRRVSLGRQNTRRNSNAFRVLERDVDCAYPHRTSSIRRSDTLIFLPASFAPVGAGAPSHFA